MFVDALHEELSRKQIREVKEIAENTNLTHEEKKSSILNEIKDFGIDTLSNIVANVLTNPAIWNNFSITPMTLVIMQPYFIPMSVMLLFGRIMV